MAIRSIVVAAVFVLASSTTGTAAARATMPMTGVAGKSVVLPALMNAAYGGYTTAIYVENVSHIGAAAHVTITYFSQSGAPLPTGDSTPQGLPFWAEWTVRQDNGHSFGPGNVGWGKITSDQEVAVFVNEFAATGDGSSYTSIQMPAGAGASLFAPTIVNNAYGGYTTGIGLANLSNATIVVFVSYRDTSGMVVTNQSFNMPAFGYTGLYSGDPQLGLPNGFIGTADIFSVSPGASLAAIVNEVGPGGQFSSYDAVTSGATSLFAPAAMHGAYGGYNTGMGIRNTTGTAGSVTVSYYDSLGTVSGTVTKAISANGYVGVYQGGPDGPPASSSGYTATITGTVALAAVVNEVAPGGMQSTSFNADTAGSGYLNLAQVESIGSDGISTGLGIMNETNTTISFTLTYFDAVTGSGIRSISLSLAPHAYMGRYTPDDLSPLTRATAWLSSSTPGLAAICNQAGTGTLMSYNGQ